MVGRNEIDEQRKQALEKFRKNIHAVMRVPFQNFLKKTPPRFQKEHIQKLINHFQKSLNQRMEKISSRDFNAKEIEAILQMETLEFLSRLSGSIADTDRQKIQSVVNAEVQQALAAFKNIHVQEKNRQKQPEVSPRSWHKKASEKLTDFANRKSLSIAFGAQKRGERRMQEARMENLKAELKEALKENPIERYIERYLKKELESLNEEERKEELERNNGESNKYVQIFNFSPEIAIQLFPKSYRTPEKIADFLFGKGTFLNDFKSADYLSQENTQDVLKSLITKVIPPNQNFLKSFRDFIGSFPMPEKAEQRDRMLRTFTELYAAEIKDENFKNKDNVLQLAHAVLLLNQDKSKTTEEQFAKDLQTKFPKTVLQGIYQDIQKAELKFWQNKEAAPPRLTAPRPQ